MTDMAGQPIASAFRAIWPDAPCIGSYVAGALHKGEGETITVENPVTGAVAFSYADAGKKIAGDAAEAAARAQPAWAALTGAARGRILQAIARAVQARADDLAMLECVSAGKPIRDTRGEVAKVAEMFEYYAGWADKFHGDVIPVPTSHLNYTRREPVGVVLQITQIGRAHV